MSVTLEQRVKIFKEDRVPFTKPLPIEDGQPEKKDLIVVRLGSHAMLRENIEQSAKIMHGGANRKIAVVSAFGKKIKDPERDQDKSVPQLLLEAYKQKSVGKGFQKEFDAVVARTQEYGEGLGTDDLLENLRSDLENKDTSYAQVLSHGERIAMQVFSQISEGRRADPENLLTINRDLDGSYTYTYWGGLAQQEKGFDVLAGGYGSNGRGGIERFPIPGSIRTASIASAAEEAKEMWIVKKVPFLSADPEIVTNYQVISEVTDSELRSRDVTGDRSVVSRESIAVALNENVEVSVRGLNDVKGGTKIVRERDSSEHMLSGIEGRKGLTAITVQAAKEHVSEFGGLHEQAGVAHEVLGAFAKNQISIHLINSLVDGVAVLFDKNQLREGGDIEGELSDLDIRNVVDEKIEVTVTREDDLGVVSLVGAGVGLYQAEVMEKAGSALHGKKIKRSTTEGNAMYVLSEEEVNDAMIALHDKFFPNTASEKSK